MPSAAILIVGNEILSGSTQDINSSWMAAELTARGIDVELVVTVPDRRPVIAEWVRRLHREHTWVFTSGGIGPTPDDVTREAVADALGVSLVLHEEAHAMLSRFLGGKMTEFDRKMAELPDGLRLVWADGNPAPAFQVRNIFILPGVPGLLRRMFASALSVLPQHPYAFRTLRSYLSEGQIAGPMIEFEARFPEVRIGSYPEWEGDRYHVDLKLETKRPALLDEALAWLRARLEELS
jgi:molybdenum cofactor synthesis domain-containing protein